MFLMADFFILHIIYIVVNRMVEERFVGILTKK